MGNTDNTIAVKWAGNPSGDYDDTADPVRCISIGGHGYVQTTLDANPKHEKQVWNLFKSGKFSEAGTLYHSVYDDIQKMYSKVSERTGGQSTVFKGLSEIVGYPIGTPRPPSGRMSESEMEELRELVK